MTAHICYFGMILAGALAAILPAQRTTRVEIDALVLDAAGEPVPSAEFGDAWNFSEGRWRAALALGRPGAPDLKAPLSSDAHGRLRGTWIQNPLETPLFGLAADRGLAVFAIADSDPQTHAAVVRGRIVMQRAVLLQGVVRTALGERAQGPIGLGLLDLDPRHAQRHAVLLFGTASFGSVTHRFALPLPPGTYSLTVQYGHGVWGGRTVVLPEGRQSVDLGPISVALKPFDLLGEVLPDWKLSRAENIPLEQASLASFRGKPLLVCFADIGRLSNRDDRRHLALLAEHARREEFHVVLFETTDHGSTPPRPSEPAVERMFPLVAAAPGMGPERLYGARWATILLDRDGRLVHYGREVAGAIEALEAHLGNVP